MKAQAVYGPPGCGKTTELMSMIAGFIDMGYTATDIAFLSHTKAAAAEALTRLNLTRSDLVSTIHSQCYRLLDLASAQLVGYTRLKAFADVIGVPIKNGSVDAEDEIQVGDEYLAIYNKARNRMIPPLDEYSESHRPGSLPQFEMFIEGYHNWKRSNGYIDFTDMLERLVARAATIDFRAKIMLVDEAQDLSALQWAVIRVLCRSSEHIIIAGDDDQAIYVWGGADPAGMVLFEEEFDAERRILTLVHKVALSIIGQVDERVEKEYLPRAEVGVLRRHGYIHGLKFRHDEDVLFLCRTGAQKKEVEKHFIEQRIPYLNDGGRPGLYQTKIAKAIRIYNKLSNGAAVTAPELQLLLDQTRLNYKAMVKDRLFPAFLKLGRMNALDIPRWSWDFYKTADLDVEPTIKISSIHGSKGREADRVVIHTGMTQRTLAGMDKDPDAEHRVFYVGVTRAKRQLDILEGDNGYNL